MSTQGFKLFLMVLAILCQSCGGGSSDRGGGPSPPAKVIGTPVLLASYMASGDWLNFGWSVGTPGDLNGDGREELLVGEPQDDMSGVGVTHVMDPELGVDLFTIPGLGTWAEGGSRVAGAGDVNNDGTPDFMDGERWYITTGGAVRVFSGVDGSEIHTLAPAGSETLGEGISSLGDLNGDGYMDFIAGDPWNDDGAVNAGRVLIFSGVDGSVLRNQAGTQGNGKYGHSVAGLGDLDGDSIPDYAVGEFESDLGANSGGSVYVYSGATGTEIFDHHDTTANNYQGSTVARTHDVNGDGTGDVIASGVIEVVVLSGLNGSVIHTVPLDGGGWNFTLTNVIGMGDWNGDGKSEFAIGHPGADGSGTSLGIVRVYNGADASVLVDIEGPQSGADFGNSIAAVDWDGDGYPELLIGAHYFDNTGTNDGAAFVYGFFE